MGNPYPWDFTLLECCRYFQFILPFLQNFKTPNKLIGFPYNNLNLAIIIIIKFTKKCSYNL